ncbi:MAG TPA: hypothetical protein VJ302_32725 [Blastocatellia bacterium]|nr:hypothetical protein [Blastocatellia bacterium]
MNPRDRVVTRLPLEQLWTDDGELSATRGRRLDREAIRELLRRGLVQFVVADIGEPLRWIPPPECFTFWKTAVAAHLAEMESFNLDDFPEGRVQVASEWSVPGAEHPVIVLEMHH